MTSVWLFSASEPGRRVRLCPVRTPCGGFEPTHSPPFQVGLRRLPFQASLATPVTMAPRRRPREGVAEKVTRQEVGDAPPPQQTQPLPQDAHSGIAPPPPPPQVAQGLDMTRFLEGMAQFVAQHRDAP
ncbi:hypothetical protein Taro_052955, partial [Colocasia esculenta]|nr:hypothetical protein [Colocasia esculenta]